MARGRRDEDEEESVGGSHRRPLSEREFPTEADVGEDDFDDTEPCPECGKGIYDDSEWCPHCGTYLQKDEGPGKKSFWVIGVLVVVMLVMAFTSMF